MEQLNSTEVVRPPFFKVRKAPPEGWTEYIKLSEEEEKYAFENFLKHRYGPGQNNVKDKVIEEKN